MIIILISAELALFIVFMARDEIEEIIGAILG